MFLGGKTLKFTISTRKSVRLLAKIFFFLRSPAFGQKICDFGRKQPSNFGENLFFLKSPAFSRKICDFGRKRPSDFDEDLFFLEITCFWSENL